MGYTSELLTKTHECMHNLPDHTNTSNLSDRINNRMRSTLYSRLPLNRHLLKLPNHLSPKPIPGYLTTQ